MLFLTNILPNLKHINIFMKFNLDNLVSEYEELENKLGDPDIFKDQKKVREVASRKKSIEGAVNLYKEYKAVNDALSDNKEMLS
ncbi:PCRF domain-containing protein [bacterium]|nr:PCRF domain-containing protein [bacterium]